MNDEMKARADGFALARTIAGRYLDDVAAIPDEDVLELYVGGSKTTAIQAHRSRAGVSLKEARDALDLWSALYLEALVVLREEEP